MNNLWAARRKLKSSEEIRHAEKAILIAEIEAHTATKAELKKVRGELADALRMLANAESELEEAHRELEAK